tara:strand:- start:1184 stop:1345 length:162 start_codon:yes stop_codon:yes gene_type:complete
MKDKFDSVKEFSKELHKFSCDEKTKNERKICQNGTSCFGELCQNHIFSHILFS